MFVKFNYLNIVLFFEFGKVEDIYYFLMEFVDGLMLCDVVSVGELFFEYVFVIVFYFCDVL